MDSSSEPVIGVPPIRWDAIGGDVDLRALVVVVAKPGRTIPPRGDRAAPPAGCGRPAVRCREPSVLAERAAHVVVAAWRGPLQIPGMGDPWHLSDHGLTAFTGYLWPRGGMWRRDTWARQLEAYWQQHSFNSGVQDLDGIYTALSLSTSGIGAVRTDPLSLAMLYRAETVDFVAYSFRAALAARAASPNDEPDRDPWGVGWLPYLSYLAGPQTGYANTVVLPIGAYVDIHPAWGSRVRNCWHPAMGGRRRRRYFERRTCAVVHDDLARSVVSTSLLPTSERLADITGGKDSRLILALMIEAGVTERFTFRTLGAPSSADAIVSADISSRFSLKHQLFTFGRMEEPAFDRRLRTQVFQTSGMYNAWNLKGRFGPTRSRCLRRRRRDPALLLWCVPTCLVTAGTARSIREPVRPLEPAEGRGGRSTRTRCVVSCVEMVESGGCTTEDLLEPSISRANATMVRCGRAAGGMGGTWYWNRYPGVMCDVESYHVSPDARGARLRAHPSATRTGEEIRLHLQAIADRSTSKSEALFHTGVTRGGMGRRGRRGGRFTPTGATLVLLATTCWRSGSSICMKLPGHRGHGRLRGSGVSHRALGLRITGGGPGEALTDLGDQVVASGRDRRQRAPRPAAAGRGGQTRLRIPAHAVGHRGARQPPTDAKFAAGCAPGWQKARMDNFQAIMLGRPVDGRPHRRRVDPSLRPQSRTRRGARA